MKIKEKNRLILKEDIPIYKRHKKFYGPSNEWIGDIYNISKEIDFNNLIHYFKGSNIAPINRIDFKGSMRIRNEIINGDTTIKKTEENKKQFKWKLNEISTGNPKYKSKNQLDMIKNVKIFMNQDERLSIYLMIMLELNLKLCVKQNMEQDLKY